MKKMMIVTAVVAMLISCGVSADSTFTACEAYKAYENVKSVYGGYVPSECEF